MPQFKPLTTLRQCVFGSDRATIQDEWIQRVIDHPVKEMIQKDSRIRRWGPITEMGGRYFARNPSSRRATVHNAFFDRSFTP